MINDLLNNIVLPIEKYKLNSSISYTILNDIISENLMIKQLIKCI